MAKQPKGSSFYEVLTAAIDDFARNGYDSQQRLDYWLAEIRKAADASLTPLHVLENQIVDLLRGTYDRLVERGAILNMHPGIPRFTIEKVKPRLRAELDRRIMANANLIKLNRNAAIAKTVQRFSGWASSVPPGGSENFDRRDTKQNIRAALASLPFEERRVAIDQGHKFTSNLSEILATDGGAIAGVWHSHWRQVGYKFRPDHKERDRLFFAVRDCWAMARGLMRAGPAGYTDDVTKPGEEIFCRCNYKWVYALRALPDEMLTAKGREELQRTKVVLS